MVLSNRRMKQKKREERELKCAAINQETPQSFTAVLDLATEEPTFSKKGKKRKDPPLLLQNDQTRGAQLSEEGKKSKNLPLLQENHEIKDAQLGEKGGEKSSEGKVETLPIKDKKKKKLLLKKKNLKKKLRKIQKRETLQKVELQKPEQIGQEVSKQNDEDAKKVYVGGMPYYSTEDDIRSYFDQCGTITDIDCMTFPETGRFRGIAILKFESEEAAKSALELDGSEMGGLFLKIQPYKTTRTIRTPDFCPPVIEGYNRIYAGNLSWDITEDDLRNFFSDCKIISIRFGEDKETAEFKGYAHVDFGDNDSLNKALKLDQKFVCGRPVKISRAVPLKGGVINTTPASTATKPENAVEVNRITEPENDSEVNTVAVEPENTSKVASGKLRRRTCYDCGERGHISSDCPKKKAEIPSST